MPYIIVKTSSGQEGRIFADTLNEAMAEAKSGGYTVVNNGNFPEASSISSTSSQSPSQPTTQQSSTTARATLSSPDGNYKTVVNVGSSEASKLMSSGWTLGNTGKSTLDINSALNYSPIASYNNQSTSTSLSDDEIFARAVAAKPGMQWDRSDRIGSFKPVVISEYKNNPDFRNEIDGLYQATSQPAAQKATLTSPDGNYKTVVDVGSKGASELQSSGWTLGNTGTNVIDINEALKIGKAEQPTTPPVAPTTPPVAPTTPPVAPTTRGYITIEKNGQQGRIYADNYQEAINLLNEENNKGAGYKLLSGGTLTEEKKTPETQVDQELLSKVEATNRELTANENFINAVFSAYKGRNATADELKQYAGMKVGEIVDIVGSKGFDSELISPDQLSTANQEQQATKASEIGARYGQPYNKDLSTTGLDMVLGVLDIFRNNSSYGVSGDTVNKIANDSTKVAMYVNAIMYGGYSIGDVLRDIKKEEAVKNGNTNLININPISTTMVAQEYYNTPEGSLAMTNAELSLPSQLEGVDTTLFNLSPYKMPEEAYSTLVKPFDWLSEEGKAEIESIKSAYHDVVLQQLNASTEQEQQLASSNYEMLKEELNKKYGINLSNNARTAWNQISSLGESYRGRGLFNTGLYNEAQDQYLNDIRRSNQLLRDQKATDEEIQKRDYYIKYATPEEVAQLSDEEKVKWGLKPSAETLAWFTPENIKKMYPDLSDEEITNYSNSIIDEGGNYRSSLYQNLFKNRLDVEQDKKAYQFGDVAYDTSGNLLGGYGALYKKALETEKAYAPYQMSLAGTFETSPSETTTPATTPSSATTTTPATTPSSATTTYQRPVNTVQETDTSTISMPGYSPEKAAAAAANLSSGQQTTDYSKINQGIRTLVDSNRQMTTTDVANMYNYFYGSNINPTGKEATYWSGKTSGQLYEAMKPNTSQFKNTKYYNDVYGQ